MTDYLHFLVRIWPVMIALIGVTLAAGICIGIGLQKNHTVRIWHKQRRLHSTQLNRARINAKLEGAKTQRRALLAANRQITNRNTLCFKSS